MGKPIIICVDDEVSLLRGLKQELAFHFDQFYSIEITESAEDALELIQELLDEGETIPLVISDYLMPGMKGDEFLIKVHQINTEIRKILLTGQADVKAVANTVNHAGLYRYISKPWEENDLKLTVDEAAKSFMVSKQLEKQVHILSDLNSQIKLLSSIIDPKSLIQNILTILSQQTGSVNLAMVFYDNSSMNLKATTKNDTIAFKSIVEDYELPINVVNQITLKKYPIIISNASKTEPYSQDAFIIAHKTRSIYCVSLVKNGNYFGFIYLDSTNANLFSSVKLDYLNLFIPQVTNLIDNALLYNDLENKVQERTKDITDSIEYASRIQNALLPNLNNLLSKVSDQFVIYNPKDIVSGDFYFTVESENETFVVVADCTGHGVPGAFLSVLGSNLLNQIIKIDKILDPISILNELQVRVKDALSQEINGRVLQDGMDLSLIKINFGLGFFEYVGANRPIFCNIANTFFEVEPDKIFIGNSHYGSDRTFHSHVFQFKKGDKVFLFSDGITDQFGGEKVKKYSKSKLYSLIESNINKKIKEIADILIFDFADWKGNIPQTDDILLVGIEF